ncbi:MAG TPA: hypothetical protein PK805_04075, partial [Acidovorax temperans]|nr:hypothetical protein [Acidovorax temperans]
MSDGSERMSRLRGGNDAAPQAHTVLHSLRSPDRKWQTVLYHGKANQRRDSLQGTAVSVAAAQGAAEQNHRHQAH